MVPGRVTSAPSRSLLRARGEEVRAPALTAPGPQPPGPPASLAGSQHPAGTPTRRASRRPGGPARAPSGESVAPARVPLKPHLPLALMRFYSCFRRGPGSRPLCLTAVGGGSADSLVPVPLAPRSGPWDGGCSAHPSLCAKPLAPADPRVVWLLAKGHNKWQQLRLGERRGEPGAVEEWVRLRARARCTALRAGRRGFCPHLTPGSLAGPWPAAVRLRWPLTRDDPAVRS